MIKDNNNIKDEPNHPRTQLIKKDLGPHDHDNDWYIDLKTLYWGCTTYLWVVILISQG